VYESALTFLVVYIGWVAATAVGGFVLERYAPRLLDRVGDWITR